MGLTYKLPEGGGNPSQFPKDMLYPCPTGRNDRTGALASRGDPKAQVWWYVQEAELFNIPYWDCPDTLKAPFYEGL